VLVTQLLRRHLLLTARRSPARHQPLHRYSCLAIHIQAVVAVGRIVPQLPQPPPKPPTLPEPHADRLKLRAGDVRQLLPLQLLPLPGQHRRHVLVVVLVVAATAAVAAVVGSDHKPCQGRRELPEAQAVQPPAQPGGQLARRPARRPRQRRRLRGPAPFRLPQGPGVGAARRELRRRWRETPPRASPSPRPRRRGGAEASSSSRGGGLGPQLHPRARAAPTASAPS
jgi:hypothetical protein